MKNFIKKNKSKLLVVLAIAIVAIVVCIYNIANLQIAINRAKEEIKAQQITVPDGYTAIKDVQGLKDMANNLSGKYILMADINLSGEEWEPIGTNNSTPFRGTFDGNYHTISNLTINSSNQYVGLFGYINGGTVQNITLNNVDITNTSTATNSCTGAVTGYTAGPINNVVVSGNVTGGQYTGGIAGSTGGAITEATNNAAVTNNGTVKAAMYTGGIAGYAGSITKGTNNGNVTGAYTVDANYQNTLNIGGIAGYSTGTVTEVINNNKITGNGTSTSSGYVNINVAGIIGDARGAITKAENNGEIEGISTGLTKTGTVYIGGIVGTATSQITEAKSTAKITGTSEMSIVHAGGIVGKKTGNIEKCYSSGEIVINGTTGYAGGIVGYQSTTGTIRNIYSTSNINGTVTDNGYVGSLIGHSYSATVQNSYAIGKINVETTGKNSVIGGLIGGGSRNNVTNSYYSPKLTGCEDNGLGTAKQVQSMLKESTYNGWQFGDVWSIDEGTSMPYIASFGEEAKVLASNYEYEVYEGDGTDENPYLIKTAEELKNIKNEVSGIYKLANDIDLSAEENFKPIASVNSPFTGKLNGDGHIIRNLHIASEEQYVGLFEYVTGTVDNLKLENVSVTNTNTLESYTGAVTGYNKGIISNIEVVSGNVTGGTHTGGLIGRGETAVTNLTNRATVEATKISTTNNCTYAGGIIGDTTGILNNVKNYGDVTETNTSSYRYAGGIVGTTTGAITEATNSGTITGGQYTGGIVGTTTGAITEATNSGTITGGQYTGGIAGTINNTSATITRVTNNGTITGGQYTGGIVGDTTGAITKTENNGEVIGTYTGYNGSNYNSSMCVGGIVGNSTGAITEATNSAKVIGTGTVTNTSTGGLFVLIGGIVGNSTGAITKVENNGEIEGIGITSKDKVCVGGIVGNSTGAITETKSTGKIIGTSEMSIVHAGGIVGKKTGNIEKCYSSGEIVINGTTGYAGGIVGYQSNTGTIKNTYTISNISGDITGASFVGSLTGYLTNTTVQNNYAIGKINVEVTETTKRVGGLVGYKPSGTVTNSYYSPKKTGYEESAGGTAKGIQELLYQDAYETWDFDDIWAIEPDGGSLAYLQCFGLPEEVTRDEVDYETRVGLTRKGTDGSILTGGTYQVKDSLGTVVREGTANSKGIFWIKDLEVGTYTVEEVTAPEGYVEDKTPRSFKMTEEGIATDVETNEEIALEIVTDPLTIQIQSTDNETGLGIQGITIALYNEDGSEVIGANGIALKAVTNEEGKVSFTKITPGTYKYKQTTTKRGYRTNETEYTATIAKDGTVIYIEENNGAIENEKIRVNVAVTVQDIETKEPLMDAKIGLYNSNNMPVTDEEGNHIILTTNENGQVIFEGLEVGSYYYKEIEAPEGYDLDETSYRFNVNQDETTTYYNNNGIMYNRLTQGTLIIRKRSNLWNTRLQGALIGLYDEEGNKVLDINGYHRRATTNSAGYATFKNVPAGIYIYRELIAPQGYKPNYTTYKVQVNEDYTITYLNEDNGTIYDYYGAYTTIKDITIGTGKAPGTNAWLYDEYGNPIYNSDGNHISGIVDENGNVTFKDVGDGNYQYKFDGDDNTYRFKVDETGEVIRVNESGKAIVDLIIEKYDSRGSTVLPGAKIALYDASNGGKVVGEYITDRYGRVTFRDLPEGNYVCRELEAPKGYVLNTDSYSITVDSKGRIIYSGDFKGKIFNTRIRSEDIVIGTGIPGVTIGIYDKDGNPILGEDGNHITGTTGENGEATFEGLEPGDYIYKVTDVPTGYKPDDTEHKFSVSEEGTLNFEEEAGGNITVEKILIDMTVRKEWVDTEAQRVHRPESIKIQVKNGNTVVQSKPITTESNKDVTFTGLEQYDNEGNEIVYTVAEQEVNEGDLKFYVSSYNAETNTIINTFTVPEDKISITVRKEWVDTEAQKSKRPESIKIQIKNGDTVVQEQPISTNENKTLTFTDLAKYDANGNEIVYTVAEREVNDGDLKFYVSSYNAETNTITNTFRVPEDKISITAHKVWEDTEAQKAKRPESIKIQIKDGYIIVDEQTISTNENKDITFTQLAKYDANGNEIEYTINEEEVSDGDLKFYVSSYNAETNTITNIFRVPGDKISITAHKVWEDTEAQRVHRPESIKIQVKNGDIVVDEQTINTNENKDITFTQLAKYDANGNEIVYRVAEQEVNDGDLKFYVSSYNAETNTITNTFRVPEDKISITAHKVWEDTEAQKAKRPESIKLQVKNGDTVVQEQPIATNENKTVTFTNLAKYDANGNEIVYTVAEQEVNEEDLRFYTSSYNAETNTITNTFRVPDDMANEKVRVVIRKEWIDTEAQKVHRPANIKIVLKNGDIVKDEATIAGNANKEVIFEDLAKYDANGNLISYTIQEQEINEGDLRYYVSSMRVDEETKAVIITNTFTLPTDTVNITVTKKWDDSNNAMEKRPNSVILKLLKGEEEVSRQIVTGSKTEDTWTHTFTRLPKYDENGNEIIYLVDEEEVNANDLSYYTKSVNQETKTVTNTYIVNASIQKVSKNTGLGLQGAIIGLYDESGVETRKETNSNGYVTFVGLEKGKTYTYKEIEAPLGYILNDAEYTLTVNSNGSITYSSNNGIIENERITSNVVIHKYEEGSSTPVAGAKIALYDINGNAVIGKDGREIVLETEEDGTITFIGIEPGTYTYKEIEAPNGFILNTNSYTFTIDENGNVTHGENNGIIYNNKIRSNVVIRKYEEGSSTPVEGAIIGLFDKDGNMLVGQDGEQIKARTNAQGYITILNLQMGTYCYKELQAPLGYVLNEEMYTFTINNDGSITHGENGGIIYNQKVKADVTIRKYEEGSNTPVEGAIIGLFDKNGNALTDESGTSIVQTTNENGTVTFEGLEPGNYTYKELQAPTGFILNTNVYTFTINNDGTITFGESGGIIYNSRVKVNVTIHKYITGTESPVAGAVIGLFDKDGNALTIDGNQITKTTGEDGTVTFTELQPGTYKYKEIQAPLGYILNEEMYTFTVNNDGSITQGENNAIIYNEMMKYSATISKYITGSQSPVEGAIIGLFDENGNNITNNEGQPILQTTNENGQVVFTNLSEGTYKYKEVQAPSGYILNEEMYTFRVNADGSITHGENGGIIYNETIKTNVTIKKYILGTETPLAGAEITLYDAEGREITTKKTKEDGIVVFENLEVGTYTYKEKIAPEGFALNEEIYTFTINENGQVIYGENNGIIYNDTIKANVVIRKYEEGSSIPVAGAIIGIFDKNGNALLGQNGEPITAITGQDGLITILNLRAGTYMYKEVQAPEGYIINNTMYTFVVEKNGNVTFDDANGIIYNTPITVDVEIIKMEKDTNKVLAGAKIGLYNVRENGQTLQTITTGENGKGTFTSLKPGTYYYKEVQAPLGYMLNETTYTFTVNANGEVIYGENNGIIYNDKIRSNVVIIKYEEGTFIPVEGAVIGLFDENGNALVKQNGEQIKATTGKDGKITISNLAAGTYCYKELQAPIGYILNDTMYTFTINENGEVIHGTNRGIIYNSPIKVNVGIIKKEKDTGKLLEGASIGLYQEGQDKAIQTVVTQENGIGIFKALKPGTYYYKEVQAPTGYNLNDTMYTFTVNKDGTATYGENNGVIYNSKIADEPVDPIDPEYPNEPTIPNLPVDPVKPEEPSDYEGLLPKTGETALLIIAVILSSSGIILIYNYIKMRKERK